MKQKSVYAPYSNWNLQSGFTNRMFQLTASSKCPLGEKYFSQIIKRPARDACLCMGDLQAPPAPHFVFLITL